MAITADRLDDLGPKMERLKAAARLSRSTNLQEAVEGTEALYLEVMDMIFEVEKMLSILEFTIVQALQLLEKEE